MDNSQQEFSAALLNPEALCPADLKTWNGGDPQWRFRIYRNNVIRSLMTAMEDTFPLTAALVGDEFFLSMARTYVIANPPRSSVLAFYGEEFPHFIANYLPAQSRPYLADVARLEFLYVRSFHAADSASLSPQDFAALSASPDALPQTSFLPHHSLCTMASPYAIFSLWQAYQEGRDVGVVDLSQGENVIIIRQGLQTIVLKITTGAYSFVTRLQQGETLATALEGAIAVEPQFDLPRTLTMLVKFGALMAVVDTMAERT